MSENASERSWRRAGADRLEAMSTEELADHLEAMPEEEIDYAEIPELGDEFFRTAELLMPRRKQAISLRLDNDLLEWLRAEPGYQSRINAVLRAYKEAEARRRRLEAQLKGHQGRPHRRARRTPADELLERADRLRKRTERLQKLTEHLIERSRKSGEVRREDLGELQTLIEGLMQDTAPPSSVGEHKDRQAGAGPARAGPAR